MNSTDKLIATLLQSSKEGNTKECWSAQPSSPTSRASSQHHRQGRLPKSSRTSSFKVAMRASPRLPRLVVGCGSTVVDNFRFVSRFPLTGEKAYLSPLPAPFSTAGGVTLNHLCWASALGAPCALLTKLGGDPNAELITSHLQRHKVDAQFVVGEPGSETAESTVYVDSAGARTIFMRRGSIASLIGNEVGYLWGGEDGPLSRAAIVTSEVSQLPLCGAAAVLSTGRQHGAIAIVDVDMPPDDACKEANLGTEEQFRDVLDVAHVVKMPKAVAQKVAAFLPLDICSSSAVELATAIAANVDAELVVVTDGHEGAVGVLRDGVQVAVPAHRVEVVRDTTGAGDAFLGGMLAHAVSGGEVRLPSCRNGLREMLDWGAACAALCVGRIGALPPLPEDGEGNGLKQLREEAAFV